LLDCRNTGETKWYSEVIIYSLATYTVYTMNHFQKKGDTAVDRFNYLHLIFCTSFIIFLAFKAMVTLF